MQSLLTTTLYADPTMARQFANTPQGVGAATLQAATN